MGYSVLKLTPELAKLYPYTWVFGDKRVALNYISNGTIARHAKLYTDTYVGQYIFIVVEEFDTLEGEGDYGL